MEILNGDHRISPKQAGYMELPGAKKDADCAKVEVAGGVSKGLGCCNIFELKSGAPKLFSCGTCEYLRKRGSTNANATSR